MSVQLARPMADPRLIRQFGKDFQTVREAMPRALRYLGAERQRQDALRTIKACRLAAVECGRALKRMHETQSYLDSYANWTSVCRALNLQPRDSYYLMDRADLIESIEGTGLAKQGGPSRRQSRVLAAIVPEDRAELVRQAEATGDTSPGSLKEWAQSLGSRARSAGRTEAEAPREKRARASGEMQHIKRCISSALATKVPEDAPPSMVEELRGHLQKAAEAAERISAAIAPMPT